VQSLSRSLTLFGLRVLYPTAPKSFPQSSTWMLISYFCCVVFFCEKQLRKVLLGKIMSISKCQPKKVWSAALLVCGGGTHCARVFEK